MMYFEKARLKWFYNMEGEYAPSNEPTRESNIYKDVQDLEDYELTNCIVYEMAIRNKDVQVLIEELIEDYINVAIPSLLQDFYGDEKKNPDLLYNNVEISKEYADKLKEYFIDPHNLYLEYPFFYKIYKTLHSFEKALVKIGKKQIADAFFELLKKNILFGYNTTKANCNTTLKIDTYSKDESQDKVRYSLKKLNDIYMDVTLNAKKNLYVDDDYILADGSRYSQFRSDEITKKTGKKTDYVTHNKIIKETNDSRYIITSERRKRGSKIDEILQKYVEIKYSRPKLFIPQILKNEFNYAIDLNLTKSEILEQVSHVVDLYKEDFSDFQNIHQIQGNTLEKLYDSYSKLPSSTKQKRYADSLFAYDYNNYFLNNNPSLTDYKIRTHNKTSIYLSISNALNSKSESSTKVQKNLKIMNEFINDLGYKTIITNQKSPQTP